MNRHSVRDATAVRRYLFVHWAGARQWRRRDLAELQGRVVALGPRAFALAAMAIGAVVAVDALAGFKGW